MGSLICERDRHRRDIQRHGGLGYRRKADGEYFNGLRG